MELGQAEKGSVAICVPKNCGLSIHPPPLKVRGRECIFGQKTREFTIFIQKYVKYSVYILTGFKMEWDELPNKSEFMSKYAKTNSP